MRRGRAGAGRAAAKRGGPTRSAGRAPADLEPADLEPTEAAEPADPASAARTICLRLLTVRPRTRSELATALRKRGIPDGCAEEVLTRFGEVGLIDDKAFAAAWVSSRHVGRGLARGALAGELRSRGIAPAIVSAAVEELDTDTELATARRLVARRLPALRDVPADVRLRRLVGMLARKGYPTGLAVGVVRDALAGSIADDEIAVLESLADG